MKPKSRRGRYTALKNQVDRLRLELMRLVPETVGAARGERSALLEAISRLDLVEATVEMAHLRTYDDPAEAGQ